MTTYICKCGRTFQKNTGAGTTGFRMPDYGPDHECYGCPFVQKECWRENGQDVDAYACRGSKVLDYQTDAYCCESKGAALHVRTLDLEFIQAFFKEYLALPGHNYEHLYHGMDSAENGRWQYSFGFTANKQGEADRNALIDRYFRSEGEQPGALPSGCDKLVRKDVTPEQEKEIVLEQIKTAKEEARPMNDKQPLQAAQYTDSVYIYYVAPDKTGRFYTFCRNGEAQGAEPSIFSPVASGSTFETAQSALDVYAMQNGNLKPCSAPEASPEMEQPENDLGPDGMEELAEYQELTRPDTAPADNSPESGNDGAHSDSDTADSENVDAEQPQGCDWQNASGDNEHPERDVEESDGAEEKASPLPDGPTLSLRLPAFDSIFNAADDALRDMARTLKTKYIESGELNLKIVIDNFGGVLRPNPKKSKGDCALKPAKVSFPIHFSDDVEFIVGADDRVILPEDREHQMNFDEIQPGQHEYPPAGGTAQVDGKTGIVEDYKPDQDEAGESSETPSEDPPATDVDAEAPPADNTSTELYPCKNIDCPFYAYDSDGPDASGCGFSDFTAEERDSFDVDAAVEEYGCARDEVQQAYADAQPKENTSEEAFEGDKTE